MGRRRWETVLKGLRMKRVLILLAICLCGALASAQTPPLESAKELEKTCTTGLRVFEHEAGTTQDAVEFGKCIGYVEGVLDSMRVLSRTDKDGKIAMFHLHGEAFVLKDAVVFFVDFMKTDKEYDHDGPAAPMIIAALKKNHLVTISAALDQKKE